MCSLVLALAALSPVLAAEHVVPSAELEQRLEAQESERDRNLADIDRLFANETAAEALAGEGMDAEQVRAVVPQLDDATLAELAVKARALETDVEGGIIGSLTVLLLLALAILIIYIAYID